MFRWVGRLIRDLAARRAARREVAGGEAARGEAAREVAGRERSAARQGSTRTVPALSYDEAKDMARSPDAEVRLRLARSPATQPEFLVYLAADTSPAVRREIAANDGTPVHAQVMLAGDEDDEVRCELARKIGRLLPDLESSQSERVSSMALQVMEKLAQDTLPRVRALVAEEVKHAANVPPALVRELAFDIEAMVSCPILEYSPLLSDADLMEIITTGAASDRLSAISRRSHVSAPVADAVVATLDVPAVATLLANKSAQIREETLDALIDSAAAIESWHEPIVMRAELSVRAMRRVSEFVASSLIAKLAERHDLDPGTQAQLRAMVKQRLVEGSSSSTGAGEAAHRKAQDMHRDGLIDDEAITTALEQGERDFVMAALVLTTGLPAEVVRRIVATRTASPVTALAWRAGLSMRTAMTLQLRLAHVPPSQVQNALYGVDYPMAPEEMERQIGLFLG